MKPVKSCAFVLWLCTACLLGFAAQAQTTFERLKESGTVRIGYANETPLAFIDTAGNLTGESPEIAKRMFAQLGIDKVEAVLTEWGALIPGLRAGRFDVIAAGMYITPQRCQQVIFSDPYSQTPDTLLVQRGNPKNLHSYADIAREAENRLAIMSGTTMLAHARQGGLNDAQIVQVPDTTAQLQAVLSRRADAAVGTIPTMKALAAKGGAAVQVASHFIDDPAHTGYAGLAFRPQDQDLRDAINERLKHWLGSDEHLAVIAPFGFDKDNLTDKKAADLCAGIY